MAQVGGGRAELRHHAGGPGSQARSIGASRPCSTDPAFNDRWYATISPHEVGPHAFTVVAWTDRFGSFVAELKKKVEAGQDVSSELLEGLHIIDARSKSAHGRDRVSLH